MSYIGQGLPDNQFIGYETEAFSGSGSANQQLSLSKQPFSESSILVVINNVVQRPTTDYAVSGSTVTLVGTVASGDVIYVTHLGATSPIGEASALDLGGQSDKLILDADADTTISADTDDQIDFKAGGTDVMSMTATGLTINDGVEITTADNTDTLTLTSTDADANAGPNLRLYRNSSSPAPNDVIGVIEIEGRNDNSEDIIYQQYQHLIADETDGTEDGYFIFSQMKAGTLTERYRLETGTFVINDPGADFDFRVESDNNTNMLYVDASADHVAINSVSDYHASLITVASGERALFVYQNANSDTTTMQIRSAYAQSSQSASMIVFQDSGGTERGSIKTTGSATAYNTSSDYRLKENVNYDWDATTRLKQLKPARFNWIIDDTNTPVDGFLAHEVSSIVPEAVAGEKDGRENYIDEDTGEEKTRIRPQDIDHSKLVPLMVKTIQELEARIKTLEDA